MMLSSNKTRWTNCNVRWTNPVIPPSPLPTRFTGMPRLNVRLFRPSCPSFSPFFATLGLGDRYHKTKHPLLFELCCPQTKHVGRTATSARRTPLDRRPHYLQDSQGCRELHGAHPSHGKNNRDLKIRGRRMSTTAGGSLNACLPTSGSRPT